MQFNPGMQWSNRISVFSNNCAVTSKKFGLRNLENVCYL